MSEQKKSSALKQLLDLISGFGESLLNIEQTLDDLNQRIARIEYKINDLSKSTEKVELTVESEYKRLEKSMDEPIFSADELKELDEMEKEFQDSIKNGDL